MGNNGDIKEEPKKKEPQTIEMRIFIEPGKPMQVGFPFLSDKIATYGFLKMAEKTIDAHYVQQKPNIIQSKGGMMDFVRRKR